MALGLAQLRQRQPTEWTRWKAIERPLWARRADETRAAHAPLARYLEGWAQADPAKIIAAVAPGYRFHDPLIGAFTQHSLPRYFDDLQARCARAGAILRQDLAFLLCGPMDEPLMGGDLAFWREAPRVGLTGIARIKFVAAGVIAEDVAYDLNLASDLLRQADVGQRDECRFPAG